MGASAENRNRKTVQRNRIKYTQEQLQQLERVFESTQYPDTTTMENLAVDLDVSLDRVSIWFQNRRSKFKRQAKDNHVSWMRKQIYNRGTASGSSSMDDQSKPPSRHVLSPPDFSTQSQNITWERPTSNLHYLPTTPPFLDQYFDRRQSPPLTACPSPPEMAMYPQYNQSTPCQATQRALMLSHLMNEQQSTGGVAYHNYPPQPMSSCLFANSYSPVPVYPTSSSPFSHFTSPQIPGIL